MQTVTRVNNNMWRETQDGLFAPVRRRFPIDGLVLYLPLGHPELSGSPIISKDLNAHSCTVTGTVHSPPISRDFDGDDRIALGSSALLQLGTSDFSFEFWVKKAAVGAEQYVIGRSQDINNRWYVKIKDTTGVIYLYCTAGGVSNVFVVQSSTDICDNAWHHIVVGGDRGTQGYIYLDGSDDTSATKTCLANDADNTGTPYLGFGESAYITASIGEYRQYNRLLSAGEVTHIYKATKWRYV